LEEKDKVDIKDLTWQDKENILRILFSKMNGISLSSKVKPKRRQKEKSWQKLSTIGQDLLNWSPLPSIRLRRQ